MSPTMFVTTILNNPVLRVCVQSSAVVPSVSYCNGNYCIPLAVQFRSNNMPLELNIRIYSNWHTLMHSTLKN